MSYASDLCAVGVVGPGGVIYETESCHRGIYTDELIGFQVIAARPASVYVSGELVARGSNRFVHLDAKVLLFVDGERIARKPLHIAVGGKVVHLPIVGVASLSRGSHRVALSIRPIEEEGLVGMTRRFSKLTVSTERPES